MRERLVPAVIGSLFVCACTAVQVQPIEPSVGLRHVCIEKNPKVLVADFVHVVRDGFDRHGISTEVYSGVKPDHCEFVLTYTALRSWDFAAYLSHAELRLESQGRRIAYAEYHLRAGGGLSLTKWRGTRSKMDPVVDQLLASY